MQLLLNWLDGGNTGIEKKSVIWNMIASIEYSVQSAILLLVITRVMGLSVAGLFTISYTVTQMMATIGSYAMRSFQVSDINREYRFKTYYTSRLVSVFAMIIICLAYSLYHGYTGEKLILIVILCMYRTMEDIEDVIHGEIQKCKRLDMGQKIVAVRILIATVLFSVSVIVTNNIVLSSCILSVSGIVICFLLNRLIINRFEDIEFVIDFKRVFKLLWICLPICVGGFLYNYLGNAPKYSIDRNLEDSMQAIFNILFIPVFVINMLSSFVFKPMIVTMGEYWMGNNIKGFIKLVVKQLIIIVGLSVVIAIGGGVIGLDIFEIIYGVSLGQYRIMFIILLLIGGLSATASYLNTVLTIMRLQKIIIVSYMSALIFDFILLDKMTKRMSLMGASLGYGVSMFIVVGIMTATVAYGLAKKAKTNNA